MKRNIFSRFAPLLILGSVAVMCLGAYKYILELEQDKFIDTASGDTAVRAVLYTAGAGSPTGSLTQLEQRKFTNTIGGDVAIRIVLPDSTYTTGTPVYVESDPVWSAASSFYLTILSAASTYATGTPVYAESDPVWSADKSNYVKTNETLPTSMFPDCVNYYYVSPCGDEANSGLNENKPKLTIQAAGDEGIYIGSRYNQTAEGIHGFIQDVRIYNKAWTADKTLNEYEQGRLSFKH